MAWSWEFLVQVFRGLGGIADNVARKPDGSGVVPLDPSRPVRLHAPENLVFPIADVEFADGWLRIKNDAAIGKGERMFFENYQEGFSWGAGGSSEAAAFIEQLDALPEDVREFLSAEFAMERLLEGGDDERTQLWFLESRRIGRRARGILAPLLELIRHDPSAQPYSEQDGLGVFGNFSTEVTVLRGDVDSFGVFRRFGLASPERMAFSMPMTLEPEHWHLAIGRNINFNSMMGTFPVPEFVIEPDAVKLSCMIVGNSGFPRVSRGIFARIMREAGRENADELFDRALHRNRMIFLKLLEVLDPHEGGLIPMLRKVARYQLQAMSWCIGSREM